MKPEEIAEIKIYNWIRPYVKEVYFNRKNIIFAPTFRIEGKYKPDLLIEDKFGVFHAIEVKPQLKTNQLLQGANQLFSKYFLEYENNNCKYFIDDKQIHISYFLFCTENCIDGHIFLKKSIIIDNRLDISKKYAVDNRLIPYLEEQRSKDFTRTLISIFLEHRKKNKEQIFNCGIGILIKDLDSNKAMAFFVKKRSKYVQGLKFFPQ